MTNYEKIKAMSVEEMADFIFTVNKITDCDTCIAYGTCSMKYGVSCRKHMTEWLLKDDEMLPEICSCGYRFEADETICPNCGKKVEEDG